MSRAWRNTLAYMPAVLMAAGIAVVSLWENPDAPLLREVSDKTLHAVMYAVFGIVIMAGVLYARHTRWSVYLVVFLSATLYGGLLELLQATCTRTRSGEWMDFVADGIGVLIGIVLMVTAFEIFHRLTTHD